MRNLRYRLARWLVGSFVTLPERDGVWIVTKSGHVTTTLEANEFTLDMSADLNLRPYGDALPWHSYEPPTRTGSFAGTVKVQ